MFSTTSDPVDDVVFNTISGAFECVTLAPVIGRDALVTTEASSLVEHTQKVQAAFKLPSGQDIEQSTRNFRIKRANMQICAKSAKINSKFLRIKFTRRT